MRVYRTVVSGIFLCVVCVVLESSVREWCRYEHGYYVCVYVFDTNRYCHHHKGMVGIKYVSMRHHLGVRLTIDFFILHDNIPYT